MAVYIGLLRGINVSGQKLIKMEELRSLLAELPFRQVRTYIQSGNIVFEAEQKETELLERMLENKIAEAYPFQVPVVVRTAPELAAVAEACPFSEAAATDGSGKAQHKLYVAFLSERPDDRQTALLQSYSSDADQFKVAGREVYILCRNGYGKSLFSNNFLESKLKVTATTRNWATVTKLIGMSSASS